MSDGPLLEVRNLVTQFHTGRGVVRAVNDVSFSVGAGETLAIVGESGSGKSVTALSVMRMVRRPGRIESGQVRFRGRDLLTLPEVQMRQVRGAGMAMIFQDPMTSLNPTMRIRDQLTEAMLAHGKFARESARARARELMELVGIPDAGARLADYPHAYSGGMRQRVMIAMAVANRPDLIIADEPTTALDVTIQAQVLDLLRTLNRELGTAVLLITHNLGVVARACEHAAVMYAGRIVEYGTVDNVFAAPRHPYTRDLLAATPRLGAGRNSALASIPGRPPDLIGRISGCAFAPRCALVEDRCHDEPPPRARQEDREWECWVTGERTESPTLLRTTLKASDEPVEPPASDRGPALLTLEAVGRFFPVRSRRSLRRAGAPTGVQAVDDVSFTVHRGETVGLVGESGCGKSTLGKAVLGIVPATSGRIVFDGTDVTHAKGAQLRQYRRRVQLVFQDPYSSLDPRMTIRGMLREPLHAHRLAEGAAADHRVSELLSLVGLDPAVAERYPHEFSGGQRQRLAIARALAVEPDLIVCDEAVSALDVSLQAQVINLFEDLRNKLHLSYLFIGHDLATVRHISDRIVVMYLGQAVEIGDADAVTADPQHPYTASLLSAVPEPDPAVERTRERIVLAGDIPSPMTPPPGCRFHTRCPIGPLAKPERTICEEQRPLLAPTREGHLAACHFPGELHQLAVTSPHEQQVTAAPAGPAARLQAGTVQTG